MPKALPASPVKSLTDTRPSVLALGVEAACLAAVRALFPFALITELPHSASSGDFGQDLNRFSVYLFGNETGDAAAGSGLNEIIYRLRQLGGRAPYLYVATGRKAYDRRQLLNLGLEDTFYLPLDLRLFELALRESLLASGARRLRAVRAADLVAEVPLDFDVFLHFPANFHHLKLVKAGGSMSQRQINRLKRHQVSTVWLPSTQMEAFDRYAEARRLTSTRRDREAQERLRIIFGRLLSSTNSNASLERSRPLVADLEDFVNQHVAGRDTREVSSDGVNEALAPSNGPYEHALNVATLAFFLARKTGVGDPKELALAALVHDLGLSEVPMEIHLTPPLDRTLEQRQAMAQHPYLTVDLLKRKRIVLESVFNLLQRHHEPRTQGSSAFPAAQLLIIADQLDELRPQELGRPRLTPAAALARMQAEVQPEYLAMALEIFSDTHARKSGAA